MAIIDDVDDIGARYHQMFGESWYPVEKPVLGLRPGAKVTITTAEDKPETVAELIEKIRNMDPPPPEAFEPTLESAKPHTSDEVRAIVERIKSGAKRVVELGLADTIVPIQPPKEIYDSLHGTTITVVKGRSEPSPSTVREAVEQVRNRYRLKTIKLDEIDTLDQAVAPAPGAAMYFPTPLDTPDAVRAAFREGLSRLNPLWYRLPSSDRS